MRTSLSYTFILHPTPLCKAYMAQYKNKKKIVGIFNVEILDRRKKLPSESILKLIKTLKLKKKLVTLKIYI